MKKKLANIICTLLIVALSVMAMFVFVGKLQNKVTFIFGRAYIWVVTGSMETEIPEQSYILIKKVTDAETEVEVDDVITFYSEDESIKGQLNTHRVTAIDYENRCFHTKGDANFAEDAATVPFENVVGIYVRNMPVMSFIGRIVMSTAGFITLMVLLFAMVCAVYIPEIVNGLKKGGESDDSEHQREMDRLVAEEVERLKRQNAETSDNGGTPPENSSPDDSENN